MNIILIELSTPQERMNLSSQEKGRRDTDALITNSKAKDFD